MTGGIVTGSGRLRRLLPATGAALIAMVALVGGPGAATAAGEPVTAPPSLLGVDTCPSPLITSVATATGQHWATPGTTVYVTGSGFSGVACRDTLAIGSVPVPVTVDSADQVHFDMPSGVGGGVVHLTVTDALGASATSTSGLDVVAPPSVSSLSTTRPLEGSSLTATGSGFTFGGLPGVAAAVSYCGAPQSAATVAADTGLGLPGPAAFCSGPVAVTFTVPYDTGAGDTGAGATAPATTLTVTPGSVTVAPEVTSQTPAGPLARGTTVTVTGTGFGPAGSVTVGGVAAAASWSDRTVTFTVPVAARSGELSLVRADATVVESTDPGLAGAAPLRSPSGPLAGGSAAAVEPGISPAPQLASGGVPAGSDAGTSGGTAAAGIARPVAGIAGPVAGVPSSGPASATAAATGGPTAGEAAAGSAVGPAIAARVGAGTGTAVQGPVVPAAGAAGAAGAPAVAARVIGLVTPHPLPLPWLIPAIVLLLVVGVAYGIVLTRVAGAGAAGIGPGRAWMPLAGVGRRLSTTPSGKVAWRLAGYLATAVLAVAYFLTATSVLMTLLTDWLPGAGAASLPAAPAYRATAVLLSVLLTGIAVRYVYYYRCWLESRHHFAHPKPVDPAVLAARDLPYMKFQVTTRGGAQPVVERTVQGLVAIADRHPWLAGRMSVEVITESAAEAAHLPVLFAAAPVPVHAECLPAGYSTPQGTGLKARALHYMVELRRAGWNAVPGRAFIVHLDEETLVTEEHLLVLVDYLSGAPRPISQGPILYPLEWDKAPWLCRAMESLRPFGCSECARVMSNPPPPHLHGSNLVVDEEVENRIGWDFGTLDGQPYIAEDLLFGLRAYALLGKDGFGWHGATMLEQPPLSVYWAVQQRLRWVLGALQGWQAMGTRGDLAAIPGPERRRLRFAVGFRVATYALGFPIGFAGLYFLLHPAVRQSALFTPLGLWRMLIMTAGLGWVASYQIGLARNLRYREMTRRARLRQHLTVLLLTPVTGLFETAGPFLALTRWMVGARQARWTPTPKTSEAAAAEVPVSAPAPAGRPRPAAARTAVSPVAGP